MLKRKSKRVLSIVLAVAMIVGLFPIAAFAEVTPDEKGLVTVSTPKAFTDAISNAAVTEIQLQNDLTISDRISVPANKTLTIDLNGQTLTYKGDQILLQNQQTLNLTDKSDSNKGKLVLEIESESNSTSAIKPYAGATANVSNITVTTTRAAFFPLGKDAAVNIDNCNVQAETYCVATNSGAQENFDVKISITNSSLTSKQACAVMLNIPGTLDMNNCTVTGSSQAVMVRAGEASISNCALSLNGTATDEYNPKEDWESGTKNVPIAALVVGSQTGSKTAYADDAVCNVTNTTISASGKNVNGAVYVSGNKENQGGFSSQLTVAGEKTAITGDVVVADSTEENPSSVIVSDNAQVTGNITNNSAFSSVALINGATLDGEVTSTSNANNVFVESKPDHESSVVALNVKTRNLYSDLATAVSEAQNGETVQLLQNITLNAPASLQDGQGAVTIEKNITIDGNNKTITAGTGFDVNKNDQGKISRGKYHVFNIQNAGNVVIKDLTIEGKSVTPDSVPRSGINIWSPNSATALTVENVTVNNCSTYGLTASGKDVDVVLNGLTTNGNAWGGVNIDTKNEGDVALTVNDADLNEVSSIVFDKGDGATKDPVATINGGNFENLVVNKGAESTKLLINGGRFNPNAATPSDGIVIDIEKHLASGLEYNPWTGEVYKEPEYTGKYSYEIFTKVGENGTISVDRYATEGDDVTITVSPDEAYLLDELTVTAGGKEVEVKDNGDGTYTFKMPSADAKIVVTFAEDPDWEPAPEMPFTDVNEGDWFYDVVLYAYDNGLMTGVSATEFAPNQTTTRGMIVSMLARLEGVTSAEDAGFADVAANDWYATAVNWAASVGVVNGYEDNTFRPNAPITREQMAAILYNYADYKGYDVSARADLSDYADAADVSSWAEDVLSWANAEGLIKGMTTTTIAPQGETTRAQTAAMFERFLTAHEA